MREKEKDDVGKVLAEFFCNRRESESEIWIKNGIQPADLRLRILDDSEVRCEFVNLQKVVLGTYRLCWVTLTSFVNQFKDWFFEEFENQPVIIIPSCVDRQPIRCLVHDDFVISMTIGIDRPEIVFCANRASVLELFDSAARAVRKLPNGGGCFRLMNADKNIIDHDLELHRQMLGIGTTVH